MTKKSKQNLISLGVYSIFIYILLIPLKLWIINISVSLIIGFLFGMLNDIIIQLRKLNGEKFTNLDEDKDQLLKS